MARRPAIRVSNHDKLGIVSAKALGGYRLRLEKITEAMTILMARGAFVFGRGFHGFSGEKHVSKTGSQQLIAGFGVTVPIPIRPHSFASGDEPLFNRLASAALNRPAAAVFDPAAMLSFGGGAEHRFPPLWLFAPQDESPSRNTKVFLFTEPRPLVGLFEQLGGIPCLLAQEDAPLGWEGWVEQMLAADFIITRSVNLAALANGLLKPALFLADFDADGQTVMLPFTLGVPLPLIGRRLRGFNRHAGMGDLLNWKRLTERRLVETLRAEGGV